MSGKANQPVEVTTYILAIDLKLTYFFKQETVAIPSDKRDGTYPFLIINDLAQEDRFRQLPFVEGEPHSRFYAGTPLTSESDINLGCLFVLDPQPRQGLTDIEKDALGTVAAMVMDYLQVSRQAAEGRRALRLSQGLRLFVQGNSSFANKVHSSRSNSSDSSTSSQGPPSLRTSRSMSSQSSGLELRLAQAEITEERSLSPVSNEELDMEIFAQATTSLPDLRQDDHSSVSSSSNEWLFRRAANLLRQSLDLDGAGGVVFLKTSDDSPHDVTDSQCNPGDSSNPAPVLSVSTRGDPFSFQASSAVCPAVNLDNEFLNQLTRRYPKGRLWSFHGDGTLSTSDDDESIGPSRKQKSKYKASETSKLNTYFPGACQVMFVPLWNANKSQWFAGCFCWTPQPTRVFSRAIDLGSIFGFASSIMTEYSRVESVIADRHKGDFISSISHELRSPLHGVLAATELFGDTRLNDFQESLIETINACGRTLLDTMNQVLDFSKIMSLQRQQRRSKRIKYPLKPKTTESNLPRMDPSVLTDVATLTEDVVDSVCLGHSHMKRSTTATIHPTIVLPTSHSKPAEEDSQVGPNSELEVVVDISNNDWLYKVQPGSLRRLIMNLLGNALKYTERGLVSVCIEATQKSKGRSRRQGPEDMVTLTISDTGRGISSEYLHTRLYTPFSQEDTLSVGAGLGLSIVRGIVNTLNGTINIQSRVGEGTTVKVSFPLERPAAEENPPSTLHTESPERKTLMASSHLRHVKLTGKRVAIWGIDSSDLVKHQFWSSIARYVTDWYGLQLVSWSANEHIDVLFAGESDLSAETLQGFPIALPSLLVFCSDSGASGDPTMKWSHLASSLVVLRRPCGPERLARGILSCLDSKPAFPALYPGTHGHKSMVSERSGREDPSPESTLSLSGHLDPPAATPLDPTLSSDNRGMSSAERDHLPYPDTESPGSSIPGNTASKTCVASSNPSSPGSPVFSVASSRHSGPRVLLVDDNHINIRLMMAFLKKHKIAVLDTAGNGRAAVDCVERSSQGYNLILMDISMPIMDGFEATRAIRAIEKERDGCVPAKIIAFTGLSSLGAESKAMDSGVDLFLTKPVSFKAVSRLIDECESKST